MNILYQFNEAYIPFACVSMTSLLENNKNEMVHFYVMGEELSSAAKDKLENGIGKYSNSVITYVDTSGIVKVLNENDILPYRGSYSAYFKIFAVDIVNLHADDRRLLYIDSDSIIMASLNDLYHRDLHGKSIGMVQESLANYRKTDCLYYNTGVILFDFDAYETNNCSGRLLDELRKKNNYADADQGIINSAIYDEIVDLGPQYNIQPGLMAYPLKRFLKIYGGNGYYTREKIHYALDNPVIYHTYRFLGQFPWHIGSLHPAKKYFDYYLALSAWSDYKRENAKLNGIIYKLERVLYRVLPPFVFLRLFCLVHTGAINISGRERQKGNNVSWF